MKISLTLSSGCRILEGKGPVILVFISPVCRAIQGFQGGWNAPLGDGSTHQRCWTLLWQVCREGTSLTGCVCPEFICSEANIQKRRRARALLEKRSVGDDSHLHGRALCQGLNDNSGWEPAQPQTILFMPCRYRLQFCNVCKIFIHG